MTKPVVTVVGSFAVGLTLRTSRMPVFGETLLGSDFDMGPGGKGSNQAVGAAMLGAQAHFAGIIGADKLGEIAVELYAEKGVDATLMRRDPDAATGVGFIILDPAGHNGIILDMGANKLMDAAFVDAAEAQIARSHVVMSVLELPVAAAARAMELGRKHGALTILNPAPATLLDERVLGHIDYLTPNETEVRVLLGLPPDDPTPTPVLARRLRQMGVGNLIVTRGARGALILTNELETEVPAVPVDVVDTTGAGDAFNAGLAVSLAEGRDLLTAVRFAGCAGAIACTRLGVIPAFGDRTAVDRLYAQTFGTTPAEKNMPEQ